MISLRPATAGDLDEVVAVFRACWTTSYAAFATPDQLAVLGPEQARALWARALADGRTTVAVDDAGAVRGLLRHAVHADRVDVHSLYVDPRHQGGGLGARLLAHALDDGARAGAHRGRLWVFADNAAARGFYESHGWHPDGVTRTQAEFGLPEVRLEHRSSGGPAAASGPAALAERLCSADLIVTAGERPPAGAVVALGSTGRCAVGCAGSRGPGLGPMTPDTWFDLASVTKLVTTCALMALVSRRAVRLDDTADRWVPGAPATLRDLLLHRSGLPQWQPLYLRARRDPDAALRTAVSMGTATGLGAGARAYSDLGFQVLGAVVAAVAGRPVAEAVDEFVARPLGLDLGAAPHSPVAAGALDDRVERRMVATGEPYPVALSGAFDAWRTGLVVGEASDGNAHHAYGGLAGHAGCFATVPTLARLGAALAAHHEHGDLWRPDVVAEFFAEGPDAGQALGFRVRRLTDGRLLHHHPGFTGCWLGFVAAEHPADRRVLALGANRLVATGPADPRGRGREAEPVPTQRLVDVALAATLEAR